MLQRSNHMFYGDFTNWMIIVSPPLIQSGISGDVQGTPAASVFQHAVHHSIYTHNLCIQLKTHGKVNESRKRPNHQQLNNNWTSLNR